MVFEIETPQGVSIYLKTLVERPISCSLLLDYIKEGFSGFLNNTSLQRGLCDLASFLLQKVGGGERASLELFCHTIHFYDKGMVPNICTMFLKENICPLTYRLGSLIFYVGP